MVADATVKWLSCKVPLGTESPLLGCISNNSFKTCTGTGRAGAAVVRGGDGGTGKLRV